MDNKYMDVAISEAKKSLKNGDVPVGAVIVKDDKIIAKAHNKREKKKMATYHAEILAIEKACKKIKDWRLNGCIMYVTLEPCKMCMGAIESSRIAKVVYGTVNEKTTNQKTIIKKGVGAEKCQKILTDFFKEKR